jgi:hypothetical protein
MAFVEVSGEPTQTESEYWDAALAAESRIRAYLTDNNVQIKKQNDFDLSVIADGMLIGKVVRTLQAHYGISLCGGVFQTHERADIERKYQKAIKIAERIAMIGCSAHDSLPYFNSVDHLARHSKET